MKKVGQFFKCLIPLAIMLGEQVIIAAILTSVKTTQYVLQHPGDTNGVMEYALTLATDTQFLLNVMAVFEVVAFITVAIIYFAGMKSKVNTIKGHFTVKTVPGIILLFMGAEILTGCLLEITSHFAPDLMEQYAELIQNSGIGEMSVLSTILTLVCAPIVEEIAFRGITMKWAGKLTTKFWVINIFQAILFGIAHGNIVQGTYAFLLGLLLGYVANKYKSLWASIIAHLVFNFTGTYLVAVVFGTGDSIPTWRLIMALGIGAVLAAGGLFISLKDKTYVEEVPAVATEEVAAEVEASEE